jgi:hypothetical protein
MNPYEILQIDHRASKAEILGAVAKALRLRRYSAFQIAQAQKALLHPVTRAAHEFLNFLDVDLLYRAPQTIKVYRAMGQQDLCLLERISFSEEEAEQTARAREKAKEGT